MITGENVVCIYQADSIDSFVGAWALWKVFPNASFIANIEHLMPSDINFRTVYVVGSSLPLESLVELSYHCHSVSVIEYRESFIRDVERNQQHIPGNVSTILDPRKSLAGICWDLFSSGQERSPIINYIEDRVLWRYFYPETRAVTSALVGYVLDFELWDRLILEPNVPELINEGNIALRRLMRDVDYALRFSQRRINIGGYNIPVVNVTPTMASDACIQMAKGEPFAACYWDTPEGREYDLISTQDGIDVSELVGVFGGQGSRYEAKFKVPRNHPLATI